MPQPPSPRRDPRRLELHGDLRIDEYHWMRERDSPELRAHLEQENAYAAAMRAGLAPLEDTLYREMVGRIQETDASCPWPFAGWLWYTRTERGLQYPIHARRRPGAGMPEQVVLDLNALAVGREFVGLGVFALSADGAKLAWSLDETGERHYTLFLQDIATGASLGEAIVDVDSVAWAADGLTLFYVRPQPDTRRPYQLWCRRLGSAAPDRLVLEESDERFDLSISRSRSLEWLFVASESLTTSEVRVLPADRPDASLRLVAGREPDHEYGIDHGGDRFFIRSNGGGRRNFRVVTAPVDDPRPASWTELVPHREEVLIEDLDVFAGHLVLCEREGGLPRLSLLDLASGASRRLELDEPSFSLAPERNAEFAARSFRFEFESLRTPPTLFELDLATFERRQLKREPVLGGFDPEAWEVSRLEATAADGARVPISLVRRRGTVPDGSHPLLLTAYGAYGIPSDDRFSSARVSLLERGVIYAIAHVRGGGELGKRWHDAGRMAAKAASFADFIACASELVARGWTRPERLAATGSSAGGLLVGAVVNQRPELFRAVLALVPFVDVIGTMLDDSLPLTVAEYEEWGDPREAGQYRWLRAYSPYDNVREQAYPAMFVRAALHDSQVPFWEAAKWVARLRAHNTGPHPILLEMELEGAGHGGRSGRYDHLRELARDQAWLLRELEAGGAVV